MTVKDLKRRCAEREYVEPRHVAIYIARTVTVASLPQVAREFGQHHTTILYAAKKMAQERAEKPALDALIASIINELRAMRAA